MGILRVYLALCVIATHAGAAGFPWQMHTGREAVQIFYIISGFYMAMVLSSRYATAREFYASRILRIFPSYWIVLAGTVVLCVTTGLITHQWFSMTPYVTHPFDHNGIAGVLLTTLANITLVGQDWVTFLSHNAGQHLRPTTAFWTDASPLTNYLLVPQCWSVGLELTFYAIVPFLNRLRSRWLAVIALAVLAARLFFYLKLDLSRDPWTYRFFPFELGLFIFGMLGYRLYARTTTHHPLLRFRCISNVSYLVGAVILILLLFLHASAVAALCRHTGTNLGFMATYPFWALAIPVLFLIFGNQKIDRTIGELSYPVYLVHHILMLVIASLAVYFGLGKAAVGPITAVASIVIALGFYHVIIAPIDRRRHRLIGADTPPSLPVEGVNLTK